MNSERQKMLTTYTKSLAPDAKKQYEQVATEFVGKVSSFTHDGVMAYVKRLQKDGYAPSTIRWQWSIWRKIFRVNGIPWEFERWETPKISEQDVQNFAMAPEDVVALIKGAKDGLLDPIESGILCLSTLYGMRRVELSKMNFTTINLKDRRLYVETAKHGRQRYHDIPEPVVDWIRPVAEYRHQISLTRLTKMLPLIEDKCGMEHQYDVAWHSIRRILDYLLIEAGVPELSVARFMRWKVSSNSMVERYHAVKIARKGADGNTSTADTEKDLQVWENHPFLPEWS